MTIAQCKAVRRKRLQDPRYKNRLKRQKSEAKQAAKIKVKKRR